jgi:hypothetical protein
MFTTQSLRDISDRASRIPTVNVDGRPHYAVRVTERMFVDIQHAVDRYRIIEQRKALRRAGIAVTVDRGREWWM